MKQNKKVIIGIIIAVIILVAIIGILSIIYVTKGKIKIGNDNSIEMEKNKSMFDSNNLIKVEKDGKIGYMTSKGKMVIEPQYESKDETSNFYGNYAEVAKKEGEDLNYMIINQKGEEIYKFEFSSDISYYEDYNIWRIEDRLYDNDLNPISPDNRSIDYKAEGYFEYETEEDEDGNTFVGLMDYKGNVTCKFQIDEDTSFRVGEVKKSDINNDIYGIIYAEKDDIETKAVINCKTGKIVINFTQDQIFHERNSIFRIVKKDEQYETNAYVEGDEIVYKIEGNEIELSFIGPVEDKILMAENSEEVEYYSLINKQKYTSDEKYNAPKGEKEIEGVKDSEYKIFREQSVPDKYGIKFKNEIIVDAQYNKIDFLPNNIFLYLQENENKSIVLLEDNNSITLYDLNKKQELYKFENTTIVKSYGHTSFITTYDNEVYNLITGKSMNFDKDLNIRFNSNYLVVEDEQNKTQTYYNTDLQEIYKQEK